jgi:hypothetical protein
MGSGQQIRLAPQFEVPESEWNVICKEIGASLLVQCGALEAGSLLPESNLPINIHPAFDWTPERWVEGSQNLMNAFMKTYNLGLRLASILIESPLILHHWARLLHADIAESVQLPPLQDNLPELYLCNPPITMQMVRRTKKVLRQVLPHWFKVRVGTLEAPIHTDNSSSSKPPACFAETADACDWEVEPEHACDMFKHREFLGCNVTFNNSYGQHAIQHVCMSLEEAEHPAQAALHLRMQLQFAFHLLHEFSHVIENLRTVNVDLEVDPDDAQGLKAFFFVKHPVSKEVYPQNYCLHLRSDIRSNEWGGVFEQDVLGISINPAHVAAHVVIPVLGLLSVPSYVSVDHEGDYEKADASNSYKVASMNWVAWWFRTENLYNSKFWRYPHWDSANEPDGSDISTYDHISVQGTDGEWKVEFCPGSGSAIETGV